MQRDVRDVEMATGMANETEMATWTKIFHVHQPCLVPDRQGHTCQPLAAEEHLCTESACAEGESLNT